MKTKLADVSCKYGAPMGRRNTIPDRNAVPKLYLEKLRWVDGDYDQGGAYWGNSGGTFIYRAEGDAEGVDERYEVFVRARSRAEAKEAIRKLIPSARFYR